MTFTARTLLVIDEAGMLDTTSLHTLLSLLPEGARMLFAGDDAQLPRVGIGRVFHDLVSEGSRVARLTQVRLQAADSKIPKVASQVREGIVPQLPAWGGETEGIFIVSPDERYAVQRRLRVQGELLVAMPTPSAMCCCCPCVTNGWGTGWLDVCLFRGCPVNPHVLRKSAGILRIYTGR